MSGRAAELAIVLVHFRTPELVVEACEALLADLGRSGLAAEIVVVDNGSDPDGRALWRGLPVRRLDPGANLGYAGGVAFGVERTSAPRLAVMNPDVLVRPGCLAALVEELDAGADVAGPQFFWDRGRRILLPPTEPARLSSELLAVLGRRFAGLALWARRAWRAHARRHWLARHSVDSISLSGALLAVRRESWERVGPFDPGYRLYFEEVDWLWRLRRAGGVARFVPRAEATHLHAQSSRRQPSAEAWYAEARARFRRRRFGARRALALERLETSGPPATPRRESALAVDESPELDRRALGCAGPGGWVELSPFPAGYPAAAERLDPAGDSWSFPPEIWRNLVFGDLWLRSLVGGREGPIVWRAAKTQARGAAG